MTYVKYEKIFKQCKEFMQLVEFFFFCRKYSENFKKKTLHLTNLKRNKQCIELLFIQLVEKQKKQDFVDK